MGKSIIRGLAVAFLAVLFLAGLNPSDAQFGKRAGAKIEIPMGYSLSDSLRSITDSTVTPNTCSGFVAPRARRMKTVGTGNDTSEAFSLVNGYLRSVTWTYRTIGRNTTGTIRVGVWLQGLNAPNGHVSHLSVAWRNIALVDSISTVRTAATLKADTSSTKNMWTPVTYDTVTGAYTHGRLILNGNASTTDTTLHVLIPNLMYPAFPLR